MTWTTEDGGARRPQFVAGTKLALRPDESLVATSRAMLVLTMGGRCSVGVKCSLCATPAAMTLCRG